MNLDFVEQSILQYVKERNRDPDGPEGYATIEVSSLASTLEFHDSYGSKDPKRPSRAVERVINELIDRELLIADPNGDGFWINARLTKEGHVHLAEMNSLFEQRFIIKPAAWLFRSLITPAAAAVVTVLVLDYFGFKG